MSESGLVCKEGLKTQKKRDFPINAEVKEILQKIRPDSVKLDSFIFTSSKGKFLDHHNFSNRAWKSILKKSGIPYRTHLVSFSTRNQLLQRSQMGSISLCFLTLSPVGFGKPFISWMDCEKILRIFNPTQFMRILRDKALLYLPSLICWELN